MALTQLTKPRARWATFKLKALRSLSRSLYDKFTESGISALDFVRADGSDESLGMQAAIDAVPDGGTLILHEGDYKFGGLSTSKKIVLELRGAKITGLGIDSDILQTARGITIKGYGTTTDHRLFVNVVDMQPQDSVIVDATAIASSNCYGIIGGRPPEPKNASRISLVGLIWNDCEIAVYFKDFRFKRIHYSNLVGDDMKLKPLTNRAGGYFNKYYCGGVFIDAQGGYTVATVSDSAATNINFTSVDPYTGDSITQTDIEVHFFAVLCDGSCTMSNHVVHSLNSDKETDNEGLLVRAGRAIITDCITVDAGGNEGSLYTKGSTYSKTSGNIVMFSTAPVSDNANRGLILTSEYCISSGNVLVNCSRGHSVRGIRTMLEGNTYIGCSSPAYLALQQDSELLVQKGETYIECATTASLPEGSYLLDRYILEDPTISLAAGSTIGSWSSNKIKNYSLKGGNVNGKGNSTKQGLLTIGAASSEVISIRGLVGRGLGGAGTAVVRVNSDLQTLIIECIELVGGEEGLRLRDRNYANLIVRGNTGLGFTGLFINENSTTVSRKRVVVNNVGADL